MLLDGHVGGVGDVEAVLLGPSDQRVLQAEEVARAVLRSVGPVVGDHPGPVADRVDVRRAATQALVVVVAAVIVPGLPGEHVILDHVGGGAGRVPDRQWHVALPVARAGQLDQVVALDERGRDGEGHRRGPVVAGHHVDTGRDRAGGLVLPRDRGRSPDEAGAFALVVAHTEGLGPERSAGGADVQGDLLALLGVGQAGEPADAGVRAVDLPGGRARLVVLLDHPAGLLPSGPGKVAGPDAVVPVVPVMRVATGAGLDGVACGAWCEQPATAAVSSSAVARTSLFGDT